MKRIHHHYKKWEDYHAGLYVKSKVDGSHVKIEYAKNLLSDPIKFGNYARKMIKSWKFASEHNLTNLEINRRAWLGQATCCYAYGVNEELVKIAWGLIDLNSQRKANNVADTVIKEFEQSLLNTQAICLKLDLV